MSTTSPPTTAAVTYSNYLHLDELLACQVCKSRDVQDQPEHDEMLFIIIHQVYELWFKQIIHELDYLIAALYSNEAPTAMHTFKRILTIFKTLVAQIDVLETMTPLSFSSFRDRLESASGFQSWQFREMGAILGRRDPSVLITHEPQDVVHERIKRRLNEPSLYDAFVDFLAANDVPIPDAILNRDVSRPHEPSAELQAALVEVYRNDPGLADVCERMVDLDEAVQEWRYRHVKMVERTIGTKPGTGGSSGVTYLKATLFRPFFGDLWAIRSEL